MLQHYGCIFGSDPEFFFKDPFTGQVVGSEKVLEGCKDGQIKTGYGKVVIDGVQAELNPTTSSCRQTAASYIAMNLRSVQDRLRELKSPLKVSFDSVVEVSKEELKSLSDRSRIFGCAPSFNIYDMEAKVGADAATYRIRAAGGHIHMGGLPSKIYWDFKIHGKYGGPKVNGKTVETDERRRLIPIFDLVVGNTCVLLDRNPLQAERRKYYGRAGEFRLPQHGVEYRTPSNFWLRSYPLMSLVFGLARYGMSVLATTLYHEGVKGQDLEKDLLEKVDFQKLIKAINTNDFNLAMENFEHLEKFVSIHSSVDNSLPLNSLYVKAVKQMANDINTHGIEAVFPEDPMEFWTSTFNTSAGWERFASNYKPLAERKPAKRKVVK